MDITGFWVVLQAIVPAMQAAAAEIPPAVAAEVVSSGSSGSLQASATLAIVSSWLIEKMKGSAWPIFKGVSYDSPGVTKAIAALTALLAAGGISATWAGETGTIIVSGLTIKAVGLSVWKFTEQYAIQEATRRAHQAFAITKKEVKATEKIVPVVTVVPGIKDGAPSTTTVVMERKVVEELVELGPVVADLGAVAGPAPAPEVVAPKPTSPQASKRYSWGPERTPILGYRGMSIVLEGGRVERVGQHQIDALRAAGYGEV